MEKTISALFMMLVFWASSLATANAQLKVVNSQEGYSNIRMNPSLNGEIITPVQNNTTVLVDQIYADENPNDKWFKVYLGDDPYCLACTPDFDRNYISGFIHSSQLLDLKELQPVDTTVFSVRYTIEEFSPDGKDITYVDNTSSIAKINGKAYFGSDCGIPSTEIVKMGIRLKGRTFSIPLDYIWSIIHARNNFRYYKNGDSYFAFQRIGDGACATDLVWVFDEGGLKQRMFGWRY